MVSLWKPTPDTTLKYKQSLEMTLFNSSQTGNINESRAERLMCVFLLLLKVYHCSIICAHWRWNSCFLNPFSLTEGSDRYYTPQEEETNEIERQQSQVHDTHARAIADDSNRNEVISMQQMCKTSAIFTKILKFT